MNDREDPSPSSAKDAQRVLATHGPIALLERLVRRVRFWAAVAILLAAGGTLGSVLGAASSARTDSDRARLAFKLSSDEIAATLGLAIGHEEDLVVSASAYVSGNPRASAADFDRWAESVHAFQRYPELENMGLVDLVRAPALRAFEAHIKASPVRPLGPSSRPLTPGFEVLPAGVRPYYCFAVAGMARSLSTYLPSGLDYCALARTLIGARDNGSSSYAPFQAKGAPALGVEVPVYRGGRVPATVAARRASFVGWLGELLVPEVVITRALAGHPNTAVTFAYGSGSSHAVFHSGHAPRSGRTALVDLHNGWTVQTAGAPVTSGIFAHENALTILLAGTLVSVLFALLIFVLGTSHTRALTLVREKTRELSHQALHDTLTGLPNRALVLDRATQMLARSARQTDVVPGALFIDVDGFKHVNDNLGHAAGDELLKVVGERLLGVVREQDTVGRLGGDEFVVLVESRSRDAPLDILADRLIDALRAPVALASTGKMFSFTASIGVAAGHYASADDLLRDADLALYAAKAAGKDRYALYDASMDPSGERRLELEIDLNAAIWSEQLFLLYQPIFEMSSRTIVGVEALARWRHPRKGVVPPDEFIPLAEESGLIVPIGSWVLREACRQAALWRAEGRELTVAVNVSARQLARAGFAEEVRAALAESGLPPASLTLEITETAVTRELDAACERLQEIRALGVRIAIDDFGTGYASLSVLKQMPVDVLKLDRTFVAALDEHSRGRELVTAIMGVGQALSLQMIAEGIEREAQMTALGEMGCELAQGFLLARPREPGAIAELLDARTAGPQLDSAAL